MTIVNSITSPTVIPSNAWGTDIGPFTKPVWIQIRKGEVHLNYDSSRPSDSNLTDGVRLFQADQVGPVEIPVDGAVVTTTTFRLSNPSGREAEVWYAPFP